MQGLMQDRPLLISSLIEHANTFHPAAEIVSRTVEGPIHRCTYGDIHRRSKQAAKALIALGVKPGERIATLAWNGYRHMELYFGVSGMGAVLHTINPRLFPEQIEYIVNHAEDQYLFFDLTFAPLVEKLAPGDEDGEGFRRDDRPRAHAGDQRAEPALLRGTGRRAGQRLRVADVRRERRVVAVLHVRARPAIRRACSTRTARRCCIRSPCACSTAWGSRPPNPRCSWCRCSTSTPGERRMPARCAGRSSCMPGPALDGKSVYELLRDEKVTLALGVPTVWLMLFNHVDAARARSEAGSVPQARGHRRLGGAARDVRALREAVRHVRRPRMGHDRDVAAGHHLQPAAQAPGGDAGATARRAAQAGPSGVRRRAQDHRRRWQAAAARRRCLRPPDGARAVDHFAAISGARAARSSTRKASSIPATSPRSMPTATCRSPTARRT